MSRAPRPPRREISRVWYLCWDKRGCSMSCSNNMNTPPSLVKVSNETEFSKHSSNIAVQHTPSIQITVKRARCIPFLCGIPSCRKSCWIEPRLVPNSYIPAFALLYGLTQQSQAKLSEHSSNIAAWGSLMHPNFFPLMHPDFFSLMHPDIFNSFWHVTKHWEFSCNRGGQFFLACAPWRSLPRFGVAFAPWTSLASTEVWSLWSDLRDAFHARSQHLSQVTFKTLCLLLWTIFLE